MAGMVLIGLFKHPHIRFFNPPFRGNPTGLQMKKLLIIITCFASLSLAACTPRWHIVHKIDVQQGNVVTQEMVNQLKVGMTRSQVQYIMGTLV